MRVFLTLSQTSASTPVPIAGEMVSPPPVTAVVARLHGLYQKKRDDELPVILGAPPQSAVDELSATGLEFARLPRALQHALMWNAGHATTIDGKVVRLRSHCGLSVEEALQLSTTTLRTCAIVTSTPTRPGGDIVWLAFSEASVLPERLDDGGSDFNFSTYIPCSTIRHDEEDTSFCLPQASPVLTSWLSNHAMDSSSEASTSKTSYRLMQTHPSISTEPGTSPASQLAQEIMGLSAGNASDIEASSVSDLLADFTSALYALRAAGASLPRVEISTGVPTDVKARLDVSRLAFNGLSGLLQRAVLWDTGYAIVRREESSSIVDVVPIYVKCGMRMADIAPDRAYFEATGCSIQECSQNSTSTSDMVYSLRARDCPMSVDGSSLSSAGSKLLAITRCAVPTSTDALNIPLAATTTVWAVGNISTSDHTAVPRLRLQLHPSSTASNKWYAIHSVPVEVSLGSCPTIPSFIIPCVTVDQPTLQQEWCRPAQSNLILTWLHQEQHQEMALATLILMAGAILVALALDLFVDRKPRFFANGRVSAASMPSLTSTLFDGGDDEGHEQEPSMGVSERTGVSSIRSAESVRSLR